MKTKKEIINMGELIYEHAIIIRPKNYSPFHKVDHE